MTLSALLDYIHVAYMCRVCMFPSPMFIVFFLLSLSVFAATYNIMAKRQGARSLQVGADIEMILSLLKEPDRSMYLKLVQHGGEAPAAAIAKELGLNKVRAWRAAQRLQEKGLVVLEKRGGRLIMRLRAKDLPIEPEKEQQKQSKKQYHKYKP